MLAIHNDVTDSLFLSTSRSPRTPLDAIIITTLTAVSDARPSDHSPLSRALFSLLTFPVSRQAERCCHNRAFTVTSSRHRRGEKIAQRCPASVAPCGSHQSVTILQLNPRLRALFQMAGNRRTFGKPRCVPSQKLA